MALVTVGDYQTAVNQILFTVDNNYGGVDSNALARNGGISQADIDTLVSAYESYKQTRKSLGGGPGS